MSLFEEHVKLKEERERKIEKGSEKEPATTLKRCFMLRTIEKLKLIVMKKKGRQVKDVVLNRTYIKH